MPLILDYLHRTKAYFSGMFRIQKAFSFFAVSILTSALWMPVSWGKPSIVNFWGTSLEVLDPADRVMGFGEALHYCSQRASRLATAKDWDWIAREHSKFPALEGKMFWAVSTEDGQVPKFVQFYTDGNLELAVVGGAQKIFDGTSGKLLWSPNEGREHWWPREKAKNHVVCVRPEESLPLSLIQPLPLEDPRMSLKIAEIGLHFRGPMKLFVLGSLLLSDVAQGRHSLSTARAVCGHYGARLPNAEDWAQTIRPEMMWLGQFNQRGMSHWRGLTFWLEDGRWVSGDSGHIGAYRMIRRENYYVDDSKPVNLTNDPNTRHAVICVAPSQAAFESGMQPPLTSFSKSFILAPEDQITLWGRVLHARSDFGIKGFWETERGDVWSPSIPTHADFKALPDFSRSQQCSQLGSGFQIPSENDFEQLSYSEASILFGDSSGALLTNAPNVFYTPENARIVDITKTPYFARSGGGYTSQMPWRGRTALTCVCRYPNCRKAHATNSRE